MQYVQLNLTPGLSVRASRVHGPISCFPYLYFQAWEGTVLWCPFKTILDPSNCSLCLVAHLFIGQVIKREYMQASIRRVLVTWLLEFKWYCLDKCQGLLLLDITEVSVENMLQQLVLSPEHLNRQQPLSWPPISEGSGGSDTATLQYHTKILEYSAQWSLKTSALSMWLSLLWGWICM